MSAPDPRVQKLLTEIGKRIVSEFVCDPSAIREMIDRIVLHPELVILPADTVRTGWSRLDDDGNVIIGNTISQHIDDGQIPVIVAPAP